MANKKTAAALSFDQALQESRKERNANLAQDMLGTNPQKLAQELLGKNRRPSTPRATPTGPSNTLASRVGITKQRSSSLPRSHTAPPRNTAAPRNPRQASHLSRPPITDDYRPSTNPPNALTSEPVSDARNNGFTGQGAVNGGPGLNIRGAAGGPYIVRASNFAPGTTAADIESVMANVSGHMTYCKLVASTPTVIAEMSFPDRTGADAVIEVFNNHRADGRMLYVYYVDGSVAAQTAARDQRQPVVAETPIAVVDTVGDDTMEVDEHAQAREVENRQREERRSRDDRGPAREPYSAPAPRYDYNDRNGQPSADDYYRSQQRSDPEYQVNRDTRDTRYGFGGGGFGGGNRYGGRGGRYRDEGRMYSDRMRRGGGQSYRP